MPLIPADGVLGVVASIAKRDPEAAAELVRLGLYESLSDQIEEVRPVLQASALAVIEKRAAAARATLLRTHVGKALSGEPEPVDLEVAKGLAIIDEYVTVAKDGLSGVLLSLFNDQHPRNAQGRFVRSDVAPDGKGLSDEQKNRAAQNTANARISDWKRDNALNEESMITAVFRDKKGREHRVPTKAADLESTMATYAGDEKNPMTLQAVAYNPAMKLSPGKEQAAFDAMRHFTGPELAGRTARSMPKTIAPEKGDEWAANWNNLSDGTDRRSYRRMKMTGQALSGVSAPGSPGDTVGGLAQLMGDLGPEAEKVIAPGIQRIAYRYRGTERRPDDKLFADVNAAGQLLDQAFPDVDPDADDEEKAQVMGPAERRRRAISEQWNAFGTRRASSDAAGVVGFYAQDSEHGKYNPDQLEMRVFGDLAVARLARAVPDPKLTELNQKAGQTPPSQGVMLDAQGRLITQAVGFNGDHYLPFDLKNLKSMQGGQYARTRATGGPTTEDIYTGLMTGVRQMQVVSNSGVFTVEFDPDLRGGRRYSDKAKKMVERYAHLLDAVGSGGLYQQDLPGERKAELYQDAMEQMNWDPQEGQNLYHDMLAQERLKSQAGIEEGFSGTEAIDRRLESEADGEISQYEANIKRKLSTGERARMKEDILRDLKTEARQGQAKPYRLDGEGYAAALAALQAEFPHYIRVVDHQELPEFFSGRKLGPAPRRNSPANDRAYVPPGQTRPNLQRSFIGEDAKRGVGRYKPRERAAAVEEGAAEGGETRQVTTTGAPRAGSTTPAPASANFPIRFAIDKDTEPLSAVIGPHSPAARKMTTLAGTVMKPLESVYGTVVAAVDDAPNDEAAMEVSPLAYLGWKWSKFPLSDRNRAFTNWMMSSQPTVDQRAAIVDALDSLEHLSGVEGGDAALYGAAGGKDAWLRQRDELLQLAELADPFAPAAENMDLAEPASGPNPKPQPYPWVLALGAKVENYDRFADSALKQNHPVGTTIEAIKQFDDKQVAASVMKQIAEIDALDQRDAHPRLGEKAAKVKQLAALQQAWAFKHARDLAEAAEGRGPDPKVWGAQGAPSPEEPGTAEKRYRSLVPAHLVHSPVVKRLAIRLEPLSPVR